LVFVRDVETKALEAEYFQFVDQVWASHPEGIVISGDIVEAPVLGEYLDLLEASFARLPSISFSGITISTADRSGDSDGSLQTTARRENV